MDLCMWTQSFVRALAYSLICRTAMRPLLHTGASPMTNIVFLATRAGTGVVVGKGRTAREATNVDTATSVARNGHASPEDGMCSVRNILQSPTSVISRGFPRRKL